MIFNKNYVISKQDVLVPAHLNFGKFILDKIRTYGDKIALVNSKSGEQLTYKELTQFSVNLGNALTGLGVKKGDVVGFGSEQRNDYMSTVLAVFFTGATLTLVEYLSGRATLQHQLGLSKPKYFICTDKYWASFKDILLSSDCIQTIITLDDEPECNFSAKNLISQSVNVDLYEPAEVIGQTDVALIAYSSGTTGLSKGIKLTHLRSIISCNLETPGNEDQKVARVGAQWYYTYDAYYTLTLYALGSKIIYSPEYTTESILKDIDNYGITFMRVVPCVVDDISKCNSVDKYDLHTLKHIQSGGAPLHTKTKERIRERLPKLKTMIQTYGITEIGLIMSELGGTTGSKRYSVGVVAPGITVKVVDLNTEEVLGPNQKGEICVRSPALLKEYIDVDAPIDEEGFFRTGDIGYYDDDLYFFIVGRSKESINYNTYEIAPEDLERVLLTHPDVLDAGVIGKPDPRAEELPAAFIVRRPGSNVTEEELIKYVDSEVVHYMKLRGGVKFIDEIPRNSRTKILRNRLREMLD